MAKIAQIPKKKRVAPAATIAIDFDGVLADPITRKPLPHALDAMDLLVKKGVRVIIFSARAGTESGKQQIANWCVEYMVRVYKITAIKPNADLFIDDRGLHHTSWFASLQEAASRLNVPLL